MNGFSRISGLALLVAATASGCVSKERQAELRAQQEALANEHRTKMETGFDRAVAAISSKDLNACATKLNHDFYTSVGLRTPSEITGQFIPSVTLTCLTRPSEFSYSIETPYAVYVA